MDKYPEKMIANCMILKRGLWENSSDADKFNSFKDNNQDLFRAAHKELLDINKEFPKTLGLDCFICAVDKFSAYKSLYRHIGKNRCKLSEVLQV